MREQFINLSSPILLKCISYLIYKYFSFSNFFLQLVTLPLQLIQFGFLCVMLSEIELVLLF